MPARIMGVGLATRPTQPLGAATLDGFKSAAGMNPNVVSWFLSMHDTIDPHDLAAAGGRGAVPMVTIEPFAAQTQAVSASVLADIAGGVYDRQLVRMATTLVSYQAPVLVRFAHEANGTWYPWSANAQGNTPADYVAAYRHTVETFRAAGAVNVVWVWGINILEGVNVDLGAIYPGDDVVDYVGVSGFWWSSRRLADPFGTIISPTLDAVGQLTSKPVFLAETGADVTTDRGRWLGAISSMVTSGRLAGFVWLELESRWGNWRLVSEADAFLLASAAMTLGLTPFGSAPALPDPVDPAVNAPDDEAPLPLPPAASDPLLGGPGGMADGGVTDGGVTDGGVTDGDAIVADPTPSDLAPPTTPPSVPPVAGEPPAPMDPSPVTPPAPQLPSGPDEAGTSRAPGSSGDAWASQLT